ncbi:hypothetical protein ACFX4I_13265 [Peribacillus sp. YIM B13472]|uniref:hypothetical protein n=1 Tax=Peribacillus sp. YIM B13472 TaxID=3366297 RepID=UPI003670563B
MNNGINSVLIHKNQETVWNAITNDEYISKWYAPGSKWNIPKLKVGEKAIFVLMPSAYNNLKDNESIPMSFTIQEIISNERFLIPRIQITLFSLSKYTQNLKSLHTWTDMNLVSLT